MDIDWNALGEVAGVSIGATVAFVVIFALGVRVLAAPGPGQAQAAPGRIEGGTPTEAPAARAQPLARGVAGLCFLACLAGVAYGLYLIIPQFH
jgi:hypothetical protein